MFVTETQSQPGGGSCGDCSFFRSSNSATTREVVQGFCSGCRAFLIGGDTCRAHRTVFHPLYALSDSGLWFLLGFFTFFKR